LLAMMCALKMSPSHYDVGTIDRARRSSVPARGQPTYRDGVLSGHGSHFGWRWLVVVAGVAVLCCLPALAAALPVSGSQLTAPQLETKIIGSQHLSFSGYAESDANFGLPALPAFSSVTPLLDGVSRMRVWQAAPDRWRVDTLSDTGENDTYQDGDSTFLWDSGEQLLTRIYGQQTIRLPRAADLQPAALAVLIIKEAGAAAKVRTLPPRRVAGQSAAGLEITPAAPESTIARADIWASPASGLPLLVEVFDRGKAQPALLSQFLQVGQWTPDAGVLTPRYSPGTGFTTTTPSDLSGVLKNLDDELLPRYLAGLARQRSPVPQVGVYGDGLATFAVLTFHHDDGSSLLTDALDAGAAPLSGADVRAGAVASAPLVNLVLVRPAHSPDVFLLVGLVSKATLEQAAAELAARPDRDVRR
jgi:hypothetical protein